MNDKTEYTSLQTVELFQEYQGTLKEAEGTPKLSKHHRGQTKSNS